MDPVTSTPRFAYDGDYSEFDQYDRTDDFMLFEPDSDFGRQFVADFKNQARENGETIYYLGDGPEGAMYGFMKDGAPPPPPTSNGKDGGDDYYAMKAQEYAREVAATKAQERARQEAGIIAPGTDCILSNVHDVRFTGLPCSVLFWNAAKSRYAVKVHVEGSESVSILVRPDALTWTTA